MNKLIATMLVSAFALTACGANAASSSTDESAALAPVPAEYAGLANPLGAEAAEKGAEVFHTSCEMCHGPQGHGDGPAGQVLDPRPGNLAEIQARAADDYLFWRIHKGKPGTAMVAWQGILSDEQIWQIVSFLRTLE